MSKGCLPGLLTLSLLTAGVGTAFAGPDKPGKKEAPKPIKMCLWPEECGHTPGKKAKTGKKIKLNMDPRFWPGAKGRVTTAIRRNGKIIYVNPDGSLALPESAIPKKKKSATSTANEEDFKSVDLKTKTADQANEMSKRSGDIKGGSKADAQKAFGDGSKSKS